MLERKERGGAMMNHSICKIQGGKGPMEGGRDDVCEITSLRRPARKRYALDYGT